MSTTETPVIPTYRSSCGPAPSASGTARTAGPARRSIFPKGACPASTVTLPAVTLTAAVGAGWRSQAVTEELPAAPARGATSHRRSALPRPSRRTRARRHLRAALIGTLLAIVAITGLSAYAAQGVTDARPTAPRQAHSSCR